jgi:hypothetical protein
MENFSQRGNRKGDYQESQSPIARCVRDEFDGIGGKVVMESSPD